MLSKYALCTIVCLYCSPLIWAQNQHKDSLFALQKDKQLVLTHTVQKDESVYALAAYYSVPSVVLSQSNDLSFYDQLAPGRLLYIPLGNYNFTQASAPKQWKALYYPLNSPQMSYAQLAEQLHMDESVLQSLNQGLAKNPVLIGWVHIQAPETVPAQLSMDKQLLSGTIQATKPVSVKKAKDTVQKVPPSDLELIYNYQTSDGKFVDSLEGTVVFFKPQTAVSSQLLFGFSNDLARGRVVKVVNPSNRQFVFVKIIANLPSTKQYLNAKLGIDGRAMSILGIRDTKLWCTMYLKY
jgi:hypothetical protein